MKFAILSEKVYVSVKAILETGNSKMKLKRGP